MKIQRKQHYLGELSTKTESWSMYFCSRVGTDGQQSDSSSALIRVRGGEPRRIVTDKLRSYGVAHRDLMPDVVPYTDDEDLARFDGALGLSGS